MKTRIILPLLLLVLLVVPAACGPETDPGVRIAKGATLKSDVRRDASPEVTETSSVSLLEGNGEFAFDLYRQLNDVEGNLFFSPYSISTALAMVYAGAAGNTAMQMADTLHFDLPSETLHPAFNWLAGEMAKRSEADVDDPFQLHSINALWGQQDYRFMVEFLDTMSRNYGAGLRIQDFINDPEAARRAINDWVSDQTGDRIQELLAHGIITGDTRMVLTNAIYFKASWYHMFSTKDTSDQPFYLEDGGTVTVPMMYQTMIFAHGEGDGYSAVQLLYQGEDISMLIIMPDEGQFEEFEAGLNYGKITEIVDGLVEHNIHLSVPKFQFESKFSLAEVLAAMGMPDAFSGSAADFSAMTDEDRLWLDNVYHQGCISVDERGTEAAAATGAYMVMSGPGTVTIDHPFIFLIRDNVTGTALFMGRVMNPLE